MLFGSVGRQGLLRVIFVVVAMTFSLTALVGCTPPRADCVSRGPYVLSGYRVTLPEEVRRNFELQGEACLVDGATPVSWLSIGPYLDIKGLEGAGLFVRAGPQEGLESSLVEMRKYATTPGPSLEGIALAENPQNPAMATYAAPPFEVVACSKTALYDVHHKPIGHPCSAYLRLHSDLIVEVKFMSGAWPSARWKELGSNVAAFAEVHFKGAST